jgi:hypothetical protein
MGKGGPLLEVGVLRVESVAVVGDDSSSASGVYGVCRAGCLGAMDVASESIVDAEVSVRVFA